MVLVGRGRRRSTWCWRGEVEGVRRGAGGEDELKVAVSDLKCLQLCASDALFVKNKVEETDKG